MIGTRDLVAAAAALALQDVVAPPTPDTHIEVQPVVDIRKHMHPKQRAAMECDAAAFDVLGGRQGGKTFFDVGWQLEGGWEVPGSVNPYFGLTGNSVDDIAWPEVVRWWGLLGWPVEDLHAAARTAKLPNGSVWRGLGTDDRRTIESRRGTKYNRIAIDEMGSQPDAWIAYFVHDLLWPTMIRDGGRMVRSGNPGLVLLGYWYDRTGPHRKVNTPLFSWTAWDNPTLGDAEDVDAFVDAWSQDRAGISLADLRQQIADGVTDGPVVAFQREWLNMWIADAGALVYPFELVRNAVDVLPTKTASGVVLDAARWVRVLAADCGVVDATAFVAWAMHPLLPDDYCIHAEKHVGMLTEAFRMRVIALKKELEINRPPRVDMGGLGKVYGADCAAHGVPVLMAEKRDKPALIRLVRDRMIAGRNKYLVEQVQPLLEQYTVLGWDPKRLSHKEGVPDDLADAANYSWRDLHNYRDKDVPSQDEDEVAKLEREAAKLKADHMRRMQSGTRVGIDQQMRRLRG